MYQNVSSQYVQAVITHALRCFNTPIPPFPHRAMHPHPHYSHTGPGVCVNTRRTERKAFNYYLPALHFPKWKVPIMVASYQSRGEQLPLP